MFAIEQRIRLKKLLKIFLLWLGWLLALALAALILRT